MVNYDPANMLRHGVVEGVKTLGPWIVHTHAKDHNPETQKATVGGRLGSLGRVHRNVKVHLLWWLVCS